MNRNDAQMLLQNLPMVQAFAEGKPVQTDRFGEWEEYEDMEFDLPPCNFRIKPKTIRIGNFDVPEPERIALTPDRSYYCPAPHFMDQTASYRWSADSGDESRLARGLVHLTREAAELHAKALISLTQAIP